MEGNDCYKFSTIQQYIDKTDDLPVRVAVDIGANVGDVTVLMRSYFPNSLIFAFEPVNEYYLHAAAAVSNDVRTKVFPLAVTAEHIYSDDLGQNRRSAVKSLKTLKGLPGSGVGYIGGSKVVPNHVANSDPTAYAELPDGVTPITLDDLVSAVLKLTGAEEIDILKMDCEGCEHSSLGSASSETLQKIRFIVGEYHGVCRMHNIMQHRLYPTHYVNLIGDANLGAFFCERKGEASTILEPDRAGMLIDRPWLCPTPIDWHCFRSEFVLPSERRMHALQHA
ncbi:MAG: FkbM family methyltransferase [Chthonomonadaceae bacterium]|nr:FkbM family methyltransferase [Chthonomonadaceae bacterium]